MNDQSGLSSDKLSVMDVTLRDGGYRDAWNATAEDILKVTLLMRRLGIDYVELGYISDCGRYGESGTLSAETLRMVQERAGRSIRSAVMVFQDEPDPIGVLQKRHGLFDLLRIPLRCERLAESRPLMEYCKRQSIPFSANLTRASAYSANELLAACDTILEYGPRFIYLADSRGAMLPNEVSVLFQLLTSEWPEQAFGFHAHDNLSLALANSLAAKDAGARIIDASLSGCGLGGGNLAVEHLLGLRHRNDISAMRRVIDAISESENRHLLPRLHLDTTVLQFAASAGLNIAQETVVDAGGNVNWIDGLQATVRDA